MKPGLNIARCPGQVKSGERPVNHETYLMGKQKICNNHISSIKCESRVGTPYPLYGKTVVWWNEAGMLCRGLVTIGRVRKKAGQVPSR